MEENFVLKLVFDFVTFVSGGPYLPFYRFSFVHSDLLLSFLLSFSFVDFIICALSTFVNIFLENFLFILIIFQH